MNDDTIVAGASSTQKKLSEFAKENNIGGLEFLSCIPGSVGGGIRMNSGCFGREFKDILISLQVIDFDGRVKTIPASKINFKYRNIDLSKDIIFLSATFKGLKKNKSEIQKYIDELKKKKDISQPTKLKTSGSTFKNPKDQTNKKVWELIKASVSSDVSFGDATISKKHSNFFINKKNAKYEEMKSLIEYVKNKVKDKTGIILDLEIVIVE